MVGQAKIPNLKPSVNFMGFGCWCSNSLISRSVLQHGQNLMWALNWFYGLERASKNWFNKLGHALLVMVHQNMSNWLFGIEELNSLSFNAPDPLVPIFEIGVRYAEMKSAMESPWVQLANFCPKTAANNNKTAEEASKKEHESPIRFSLSSHCLCIYATMWWRWNNLSNTLSPFPPPPLNLRKASKKQAPVVWPFRYG